MYNADQKKQFILNYTKTDSTRKACVALFNALEPMEESWGADISTVGANSAKEAIENVVGMRMDSITQRLAILRKYAQWCLDNNKEGARGDLLIVKIDSEAKMRKQTVKNPKHLQAYLNAICSPESEQKADNVIRCYFWLAYAGLDEEDALRVNSKDVDLARMIITLDGREYVLPRESRAAISNCKTLKSFRFDHPNYTANSPVERNRAAGEKILRGVRSEPTSNVIRSVASRAARIAERNNKTDLRLSYFRVWLSGLFYRIYEDDVAGIIDVHAAFVSYAEEEERRKNPELDMTDKAQRTKVLHVANTYFRDYKRWKATLQ